MTDLPADFWSGWIIVLTVTSFAGLGWLVLSVYFTPPSSAHDGDEPVWDETLREGSNPAPIWWFWLILAAMVFSVIYLMLYPGLGSYAGALKWSQGGQLEEHQLLFTAEFDEVRSSMLAQSMDELAEDPLAMRAAATLFRHNCSACHGTNATGQADLFPDLRDSDWQWGGSHEQIEQTIRSGRNAMMIPWQAVLGEEGIDRVADFVSSLSATAQPAVAPTEQAHPGQLQYTQFCVACHGASGDGNPLLGAPRLNDDIWLYGGNAASIRASIGGGRNGQMPAFGERLDDLQIKLLVAWLAQ